MDVTRRDFLYCAAAAAAAASVRPRSRRREKSLGGGCVILDLGEHCALRESLAGYQAALGEAETVAGSVVIVPAALAIAPAAARRLIRQIEAGGTLILESGATFAAPEGPEFRGHRNALRELLGIDVEPPRRVVRAGMLVPYVDFRWPSRALVRDFGAIVPVAAHDGESIARLEDTTVAIARRRGDGMLIFLGSPIGPALWAGDADARRWLREVLRGAWNPRRIAVA